jgi:DNA-directed RNA polymerase subunit H
MTDINIQHHTLVPPHSVLSDAEAKELLARYNIVKKQLPIISIKDPGIQHLDVKPGLIIKIIRTSPTQGTSTFYRLVKE